MEYQFNNKTILITGLVVASICALFLNYEQIALAIVSGLLGYLAKDPQIIDNSDNIAELQRPNSIEEDIQDYGSDSETA